MSAPAHSTGSAQHAARSLAQQAADTDLDSYVKQPSRTELVKQVRAKIKELGVTYIYYQFVSVTGRIVGKGVPADHWESIAGRGFQLVYGATANLFLDRHNQYIGYGPEAMELVGIPDPETFCQLPWDKRVGRVFCTIFRNREEKEGAGAFLTSDCRGNLRRTHQQFQSDHGLHMRHGCEPEMMWLKKDAEGNIGSGATKAYCYHIDQFETLRPVLLRAIDYARAMGLDMIQGDHEDSPGQVELNYAFDEALRTCDRLTTYRQICAQVAREHNLLACFMTKPFMGVSASGCHHNISLWRGGKDSVSSFDLNELPAMEDVFTYRAGGENTFMPDDLADPQRPGRIGLHCIGGVMEHLDALTAIGCSTVNSYRRLWDTGYWAPVYRDWGYQNRTCGLRVSAPGRFEYRAVDSMVNPYLMASALLKAFDDGLRRKLDPGPPEQRNIYKAIDTGKVVTKLPMSLGQALDALSKDEVIKSALPGDMLRVYNHYKYDEWERFLATSTEWDKQMYLDYLP